MAKFTNSLVVKDKLVVEGDIVGGNSLEVNGVPLTPHYYDDILSIPDDSIIEEIKSQTCLMIGGLIYIHATGKLKSSVTSLAVNNQYKMYDIDVSKFKNNPFTNHRHTFTYTMPVTLPIGDVGISADGCTTIGDNPTTYFISPSNYTISTSGLAWLYVDFYLVVAMNPR